MSSPSDPAPLFSDFASDPEMKELIEMFVSELPDRIEALSKAWNESEFELVGRLAHQLKGAGGGYGFPVIGEAAGRLEQRVREAGQDAAGSIGNGIGELAELCRRASSKAA
jgi:HPt (histidine-containing phosphotransfer) domain-containing protein